MVLEYVRRILQANAMSFASYYKEAGFIYIWPNRAAFEQARGNPISIIDARHSNMDNVDIYQAVIPIEVL